MFSVQGDQESDRPPGTVVLVSDTSEILLVPTPTADPNDPLNWSFARKALNVAIVYALTIAIMSALVMQTVFWPQMTVDLDITFSQLNAGLSCNTAGLAVGCVFIIPFTKKYGRRSTYVLTTAALAGTSWWSARMTNVSEMYITNLIYGLAGSAIETIAELTISDLFFVHQRGSANGLYIIAFMLGNTLIPTISGVQAEAQGWRWAYYTVAICLTVLTLISLVAFEETKYTPVSFGQRTPSHLDPGSCAEDGNCSSKADEANMATNSQKTDDADREQSNLEATTPMRPLRERLRFLSPTPMSIWQCFLSPWETALLPHVLYAAVQCANAVAFIIMISSINPIVFSASPYNFGTAGVGLMLVGPFIGNAIGSLYGGFCGDWLVVRLARRNLGLFEPEFRLYILAIPALTAGAGMVVYGVTLDRGMHWIYPSIGSSMFAFSMGSIMDMSFTVVIDTYQDVSNVGTPAKITAESFVFITFVRNAATVGLPFGVVPWIENMGLTNVGIISGCVSSGIALLFIPVLIWGKRMRIATAPRYEMLARRAAAMN